MPFRAMPSQTTPLVNKILLLSSLNIHTKLYKDVIFIVSFSLSFSLWAEVAVEPLRIWEVLVPYLSS